MRKTTHILAVTFLIQFLFPTLGCKDSKNDEFRGWDKAHGNSLGNKYSSLAVIDTGNVKGLQVAWTYHTGDSDTAAHSQIQCNPIVVDGVLYGTSPQLKLFALDAGTGKEKWVYSPFDTIKGDPSSHFIMNNNRGVTYWSDGKEDKRIFYTAGSDMHAIDARSGKLIASFGTNGKIDLHEALGDNFKELFITATSPPSVYKDLLITGTRVSEGTDAAPGHIRAFDVRTGKMKWIFHTIPQPGEFGHSTWNNPDAWKTIGGANNWMGMTIDPESGIAYIPLGSASMDFYGGRRLGSTLFANCLLALDAATGKRLWHFQYIHHDIWDWDPSSPPVLLTVNHGGNKIKAVAQTTKNGFVYIFDRQSGKPLFPVVETQVDTTTDLIGEKLWPTQPLPQKPAAFVRQSFTEKDINPYLSKEEYEEVKKRLATLNTGKMFLPHSKKGTITFPGLDGGAEWGGPAVDNETGVLYVNANETPWVMNMFEASKKPKTENFEKAGIRLYEKNCSGCHGKNKEGGGNYPSITDAPKKYDLKNFIEFVNTGRRMMPAFKHLSSQDKEAIASYVLNDKKLKGREYMVRQDAMDSFRTVPYNISGYTKFLSKSNQPAIAPPWGVLNAIDLNSGEFLWRITLGEDSVYKAKGVKETGTENYGGPVVTRGGLLFIAATKDAKMRAFNKQNGKLLWETSLPAPGFATPATYEVGGRQFIVIACGGGKLGTRSGDAYVAFALPANTQ